MTVAITFEGGTRLIAPPSARGRVTVLVFPKHADDHEWRSYELDTVSGVIDTDETARALEIVAARNMAARAAAIVRAKLRTGQSRHVPGYGVVVVPRARR